MTFAFNLVFLLSLCFPLPALAGDARHGLTNVGQAGTSLAEGEVRRIDRETNKLTIRHGPLVDLDMPAMTMVFRMQDPAMLEQLKVGDKIRFQAEKAGGAYTVTRIERAGSAKGNDAGG